MKPLPPTGTAQLLEVISPHIPDELINLLFFQKPGPGRRHSFSAAQLFRVILLALLTPAHSFNLLVQLLPENRAWRSFARLRNRFRLPDAKMLHQFRDRLDLIKLRRINEHLLQPLMEGTHHFAKTIALIDSTDLPAATNAYKKTLLANTARMGRRLAVAVARMGKAAGSLATKSTRSGSGCANILTPFCWHH